MDVIDADAYVLENERVCDYARPGNNPNYYYSRDLNH
jgi:hypothetical protein